MSDPFLCIKASLGTEGARTPLLSCSQRTEMPAVVQWLMAPLQEPFHEAQSPRSHLQNHVKNLFKVQLCCQNLTASCYPSYSLIRVRNQTQWFSSLCYYHEYISWTENSVPCCCLPFLWEVWSAMTLNLVWCEASSEICEPVAQEWITHQPTPRYLGAACVWSIWWVPLPDYLDLNTFSHYLVVSYLARYFPCL